MNCTYCGSEYSNTIITGKVTQVLNASMTVKYSKKPRFDKEGNPRVLKDNEFMFYIRRGEHEFGFCKISCVAKYMGFDDDSAGND